MNKTYTHYLELVLESITNVNKSSESVISYSYTISTNQNEDIIISSIRKQLINLENIKTRKDIYDMVEMAYRSHGKGVQDIIIFCNAETESDNAFKDADLIDSCICRITLNNNNNEIKK